MNRLKTPIFIFVILTVIGFAAVEAQASHFRYGNVSYQPVLDANGIPTGNVQFRIQEGWRRSAFGTPVIGSVVNTGTFSFGDGGTVNVSITVTSYSATEDWFVGEMTVTHFYGGVGPYTAFVFNCCRISNLNNGADGNFRYESLVRPYSTNRSPTSALPPVVSMSVSANSSFTLVAADADGDTLRYRLATVAEMGVANPAGLAIDPTSGIVSWNTVGLNQTNFWAAQFVVEDLDTSGNVRSKTPVDVLLKLVQSIGTPPECRINNATANHSVTVSAGSPVSFTVTGLDADIDPGTGQPNTPVTLNVSGLPIGATMTPSLLLTAPSPVQSILNWTPTAANAGTNTVTFSCTDNTGQQDLITASIFVQTNQAPVAVNDSYSVDEDSTLNIAAAGVLSNDSDPDNNPLTAALVSGPSNALAFAFNANGSFDYTPAGNFNGTDSFTYKASDGQLDSNTVTVTITVNAVNDAPTISSAVGITRTQAASASASQIATVADPDNPAGLLTVSVNGGASSTVNGVTVSSVSVNAAGQVSASIVAACGATNASFTLVVTDPGPGSLTAQATLNVTVLNETVPPVINPIANVVVTLPLNSSATSMPVSFPLPTATDNCPGVTVSTQPISGSVFQVGTTTVNVTATDANGNVSTAAFTVSVRYPFPGFTGRVYNPPATNFWTAGNNVLMSFSLSGNRGLNILAPNSPSSQQVNCMTGAPMSMSSPATSAFGLMFFGGQYHYYWMTDPSWAGTCRLFSMAFNDGTTRTLNFWFYNSTDPVKFPSATPTKKGVL